MKLQPHTECWRAEQRRLVDLVCALGMISFFALPARAQLQEERAVKVAFVFNLTKYVEWPASTQKFVIGIVGDGPMAEPLATQLAGKISESRPLVVIQDPSDIQLNRCNILYVALSSPNKVRATLDRVRDKAILTISDSDFFARDGGMIGLVKTGDQVQIQVNLEVAQVAGLRISSRLLNLSTIVHGTHGAKN